MKHPTQAAAADALEISDAYLSDMLNERRGISDNTLEKLGLVKIVTVVKAQNAS